jgi:hypothetical protein
MSTPIPPAVRAKRDKSRQILGRLLSHFEGHPLPNDECLPEIEQEIQTAIKQLRFESAETKERFVQNLRTSCMIYKLLPEVYRRQPPRLNSRLKHAQRMRRLAEASQDSHIADELGRLADQVSSGEKLKSEHISWGQSEAIANLAVELNDLFLAQRFKKMRWRAIANLIAATFDLDETDRDYGEKWARKLVQRHEDKQRGITAAFNIETKELVEEPQCVAIEKEQEPWSRGRGPGPRKFYDDEDTGERFALAAEELSIALSRGRRLTPNGNTLQRVKKTPTRST